MSYRQIDLFGGIELIAPGVLMKTANTGGLKNTEVI